VDSSRKSTLSDAKTFPGWTSLFDSRCGEHCLNCALEVSALRLDADGRRELVSMRWGLVPFFWKKRLMELPATFNTGEKGRNSRICSRRPTARRSSPSPAMGSLDRSGDEGRNSVLHDHCLGRIRVDDALSRSHAGVAAVEDFDAWFNGSLGADALRPAAESALRERPVSRSVNRTGVGDDDPTIRRSSRKWKLLRLGLKG